MGGEGDGVLGLKEMVSIEGGYERGGRNSGMSSRGGVMTNTKNSLIF